MHILLLRPLMSMANPGNFQRGWRSTIKFDFQKGVPLLFFVFKEGVLSLYAFFYSILAKFSNKKEGEGCSLNIPYEIKINHYINRTHEHIS
jgi:hypothetical protein